MPPRVIQIDWQLVEQLTEQGLSQTEIGRRVGVAQSTLATKISKAPAEVRQRIIDAGARADKAKASLQVPAATEQVSREELLDAEVKELRKALVKDRGATVKEERLTRSIEDAIATVEPPPRARSAKMHPVASSDAHHRQVTVWSDWHGGEIVDPDQVNGLNAYNWQIQEQRVEELIQALLSHKRRSPALTGLDILLVGDMCSGSNHEELAETNQYPLAEQGVKMGYLIGRSIERLVGHYPNIRVLSVVGNHPRLVKKPAAKNVIDNMDWVAAVIAREYLKPYPTVTFTVPTSAAAFWEVAGQTLYVWHGDGVRSSMPGVPWGGVMRRVNEIRRNFSGRQIDGWVLGHYHQCNVLRDLGIYMNGSLKGTDEWVLKNFGGGSPPCQLLLTFDEKRSRLTDTRFLTPTAGLELAA